MLQKNASRQSSPPSTLLRRWILSLAKVGASVAIMVWLVRHLDLGRMETVWATASLIWLLPVMLIKGVGIFSSVLRWRYLLRGQGLEVPLRHLVGSFLVGRFIGIVVPSTLGLDAYRAYDIAKHAKAPAKSIAVILVEKVIGMFALGLLLLLTLPGGRAFLPPQALLLLLGIFLVPVTIASYLLLKPGAVEVLNERFMPRAGGLREKVGKAAKAAGLFAHQRKTLLIATGFGLLVHGCTAAMYLFTARAVGADVETSSLLFAAPLMIVATLIPISFSGFGVREGTFVYLLAQVGVPAEQAALLGTLGFVGGESFSLVGGVIFLLRGKNYAPEIAELSAGLRATDLAELATPEAPSSSEGVVSEVLDLELKQGPSLAAGGES